MLAVAKRPVLRRPATAQGGASGLEADLDSAAVPIEALHDLSADEASLPPEELEDEDGGDAGEYFRKWQFRLRAHGHDDPREFPGAAVKAWRYLIFDSDGNLIPLARAGATWVAGDADDAVLGYLFGEVRSFEFGSQPCGWIFAVGVDDDWRRRGVWLGPGSPTIKGQRFSITIS